MCSPISRLRGAGSGSSPTAAERKPGLCNNAIKQEYEQQDRDSQPEWRLLDRGEYAACRDGHQSQESCQGQKAMAHTFGEQPHGTNQVVKIVKPLQKPFQ